MTSEPQLRDPEFNQHIRDRMLLQIVTAGAVVLIGLGVVIYTVSHALVLSQIKDTTRHRVSLAACKIDSWLHSKAQVVRTLAEAIAREKDRSKAALEPFLVDLTRKHEAILFMGFEDGRYIDGEGWAPPPDYDPRARSWYRETVEADGLTYTTPYRDGETGRIVVSIAAPVRAGGERIGVIAMDVPTETILRTIHNLRIGRGSDAALIHSDGRYVVHRDKDMILNADKTIQSGPDGTAFLHYVHAERPVMIGKSQAGYTVFSAVPSPGWTIIFHLPASEVNKPVNRLALYFAIGTVLALLVLSLMVSMISGILARPILTLADGAGQIGAGRYETRVNVPRRDEIGFLAYSFNRMAGGLQEREEFREQKERYQSELNVARDIQMGLLPKTFPAFPDRAEFDIHALMEPAREVGGDLYDFFFIDDDHLCLLVGDVSDKGVPAALFMTMAKSLLKNEARHGQAPGTILEGVNNSLCEENHNNQFVTVFLGILDLRCGEMRFASGGHNPPCLLRAATGEIELLTAEGIVVGAMPDMAMETRSVALSPGDMLLCYTDGVTEAIDPEEAEFGTDRLEALLRESKGASCAALLDEILQAVKTFAGAQPQFDDITLLALEYRGPGKDAL